MKMNLKKIVSVISLVVILNCLIISIVPTTVFAQTKPAPLTTQQRCDNFKKQFTIGSGSNQISIIGDLPVYCSATSLGVIVINYLLAISGTVTILLLILGGFWYLTSAGDEEMAEKGKKTIVNSVIGLVVIILSFAIVRIATSILTVGK